MRVSYRQSATDTSTAFRVTPSGRLKNIKAFTILNSRSFFRPIVFKKKAKIITWLLVDMKFLSECSISPTMSQLINNGKVWKYLKN